MKKTPIDFDEFINNPKVTPLFPRSHYMGNRKTKKLTARAKFLRNMVLRNLLLFYIFFGIAMALSPSSRSVWLLENILVFLFIGMLAATYKFFQFSNFSYFVITTFLVLYTIGIHYSYNIPFNDWLKIRLELSPNYCHNIIHFFFGLLLTYPAMEVLRRTCNILGFQSYLLTIAVIIAVGTSYEILGMWIAKVSSPLLWEVFIKVQGNSWSMQNNMASVFFGSLVTSILLIISNKISNKYV